MVVRCSGFRLLKVSAQDNSLNLQTTRRHLTDQGVSDSADGQLVDGSPADHDASSGERCLVAVAVWDKTQETQDEQHAGEANKTVHVQRSTAKAHRHQTPGSKHTDHVDGVLAEGKGVRLGLGQTSLLEEVSGIVGEGVAAQVLDSPDHADNLSTAAVDTLKAVPVRGTSSQLLLESSCVDHHSNGLVGVEIGFAVETGQSEQGLLGVIQATLADQPPGRFGSKEDHDTERKGPDPLESVGNSVSPLVLAVQHGVDDSDTNLLADSPAEVDIGGEVTTEGDGADLGGVGDGDGLEDTPRDTTEDLGGEQSLYILSSEEYGDAARQPDEAANDGVAVSKTLRDPTVDEETNDGTAVGTLLEISACASDAVWVAWWWIGVCSNLHCSDRPAKGQESRRCRHQ